MNIKIGTSEVYTQQGSHHGWNPSPQKHGLCYFRVVVTLLIIVNRLFSMWRCAGHTWPLLPGSHYNLSTPAQTNIARHFQESHFGQGVAWGYSAYLPCAGPWVPSSVQKQNKTNTNYRGKEPSPPPRPLHEEHLKFRAAEPSASCLMVLAPRRV